LSKFTQSNHILTLIKSISGIRGTIGGTPGSALTPIDITTLAAGYGQWIKSQCENPIVVIGRDGRLTGPLVQSFVSGTLIMMGVAVVDLDLSTTPTVEMAIPHLKADGGIIITASHNPMNWNALKLLNNKGEFLDAEAGESVLKYAENVDSIEFSDIQSLALYHRESGMLDFHIDQILALPYVQQEAIAKKKFHVVIDPINSSGAFAIPALLDRLGVTYDMVHGEIEGEFGHNPEPLAAHLTDLSDKVRATDADLGISVDPDVDRLAFVCEDGSMFGEENTLVAIADYLLPIQEGDTVSNLSSSRALRDVTEKHGYQYHASAVGEVNVVAMMKAQKAVLGGEGNGGIILPELHYGRDALAGIALMLSYIAMQNRSVSQIKSYLPTYFMSKNKVTLEQGMDPQIILDEIKTQYADHEGINLIDGVKIDFDNTWIHMRKSNTEPIIRVYSEAPSQAEADALTARFAEELLKIA